MDDDDMGVAVMAAALWRGVEGGGCSERVGVRVGELVVV